MPNLVPSPVALVTGSSRGIGRQIAIQLAARGARVVLHCRENRTAAESVLSELQGSGHTIFQADLTDPAALEQLWGATVSHYAHVDILVNNAAAHGEHPPLSTTHAKWKSEWERILETNLVGPANLCHLAANTMATLGGGRIVNISSRGAFRGEPDSPAYGASKAGLNSLSQSLAKALAPKKVFVYCLAPGWVETEMSREHLAGAKGAEIRSQHPLGRVTKAEEVAQAAVFCALDAPEAMTGSVIDVNGASYLRT